MGNKNEAFEIKNLRLQSCNQIFQKLPSAETYLTTHGHPGDRKNQVPREDLIQAIRNAYHCEWYETLVCCLSLYSRCLVDIY